MIVLEHHVRCLDKYGLQGQQISALGNALGNVKRKMYNTPCMAKEQICS